MPKELSISIQICDHDNNKINQEQIGSYLISDLIGLEDIGINHEEQLKIMKSIQSAFIDQQMQDLVLFDGKSNCPKCGSKIVKNGKEKSLYSDCLNDIDVCMQKFICNSPSCSWTFNPSVRNIFNSRISPELAKAHARIGSCCSYRKASTFINTLCGANRSINNHMRIRTNVNEMGKDICNHENRYPSSIYTSQNSNPIPAKELVVGVDGGYVHDADNIGSNFEIMAAKIYSPNNIEQVSKDRHIITQKHCVSSAIKDGQTTMIDRLKIAAKKEGIASSTKVTVLADGAKNCWNVALSLTLMCASMLLILDWFHIAKKFTQLTNKLPDECRQLINDAKESFWSGNTKLGFEALRNLKKQVKSDGLKESIDDLIGYLTNNNQQLINYESRHEKGLPYTSQVAESTIEHLINERLRKKQKMRWKRDNADNLLQVRCAIVNGSFNDYWNAKCQLHRAA